MSDLVGNPIDRKRGDTAPDKITVLDSENNNAVLDNTGFSYVLTVNTVKDPDPALPYGTELVSIAGFPGGADGTVEFPWTDVQADQAPGCYWYDIQQTDAAGKTKTIAKNAYTFNQDVGKT